MCTDRALCVCVNVVFVSAKRLVVYRCTVPMESSHEETLHVQRLNLLCRVCGGRSKRVKESCAKSCALVTAELQIFHSIDILEDRPETHSGTVCSKCYSRLMTLKHSEVPSSTTLEKAKADIESAAKLWVRYDGHLSVSECPVCFQAVQQKRGGRPVKKAGRPKRQKTESSPVYKQLCVPSPLSAYEPVWPSGKALGL